MRPYVWNGISHTQYHMGVVIVPRFLPVMSVATSASSDLSISIKKGLVAPHLQETQLVGPILNVR